MLIRRPVDARWIIALAVLGCIAGWTAHAPLLARFPGPWAEDAALFLPAAARSGLSSLFEPYSGYLHLLPRLLALAIVKGFDVEDYGAAVFWSSLAAAGMVFWYLVTASLTLGRRIALALGLALVCPPGEVIGNITNTQWLFLLVVVVGTIEGEGNVHRPRTVSRVLLALACLTGPFSAMWLIVRSIVRRQVRPSTVPDWILLVGGMVQLAVFAFARDSSAPPLIVTPSSVAGLARFAVTNPYLLLLALPVLTQVLDRKLWSGEGADGIQISISIFLMALLTAALAWFRYVAHPDFTGFEIGGDGGRYYFAQSALAVCSLVWTASRRATLVHAGAGIIPIFIGGTYFNSPYQRIEWSWRVAVARAEVAGADQVAAAPRGWFLPRTEGMKGWGQRMRWAYEAERPSGRFEAAADCIAGLAVGGAEADGVSEISGVVSASDAARASYVVLRRLDGTAIGYGVVYRDVLGHALRTGSVRRFRAFAASRDLPALGSMSILAVDRSVVCSRTWQEPG